MIRSLHLHSLATVVGVSLAGLSVSASAARAQEAPADNRDEIIHVLNRITFGPKPGDVEAVQKMGLHNYIEQQLHPETIDDSATDQALAGFDILQMSDTDLAKLFFDEQKTQQLKQQLQAQQAKDGMPQAPNKPGQQVQPPAPFRPPNISQTGQPGAPNDGPPMDMDELRARINAMMGNNSQVRSVTAVGQLEQAKLVRAVDSNRQLQEVLVDFWSNHFNIDMKKGPDRVLKVADDRNVIRPHIWGRFRDLLEASAKSPAMLFYLDNAQNTKSFEITPMMAEMAERMKDNGKPVPPMLAGAKAGDQRGGINENYAREIMELHTLGVDGGYTQQDVQEVARCFTGWSIDRETGTFAFHPRAHDDGAKVVLGHQIPAGGGMKDAETVMDILCSSPATAHHIALEMCERFVSDSPPEDLVKRVANVFLQTDGDLRRVTEAILTSPEFLSPADYNTKIKSPLEFAVSAVRASGATIVPQQQAPFDKIVPMMEGAAVMGRQQAADRIAARPRQSLNFHIYELGEPLFACTPPTGYPEVSKNWVSPGALIERLNFAMALTEHKISDVQFDPKSILNGTDLDKPDDVLNKSVTVLLQNNITDATRKVLETTVLPANGDGKTVDSGKLIALLIGSPEFQRK
jgi:uncharacterized protein (DUF1800 family)